MQVLTLVVSRKQFAEITVTVPDGFDTRTLYHGVNSKHIAKACDAIDVRFEDEFDQEVEVEQITAHKGEDAEKQLKDYNHVALEDAAPALVAAWRKENDRKAEVEFARMKKAAEVIP